MRKGLALNYDGSMWEIELTSPDIKGVFKYFSVIREIFMDDGECLLRENYS